MSERRWTLIPVEENTMDKINLPFFYQLGTQLNPLTKMKAEPQNRIAIYVAGFTARNNVTVLLNWTGGLKVCRASAQAFIAAMDGVQKWVTSAKVEDYTKPNPITDLTFQQVIDKAKTFETVLSEELLTLSAYSASQKGIYSTSDLIERAANAFPSSVLQKLSADTVREVTEAGKCLAFDVATASGFHMLRATEEVLHEYYVVVYKPEKKDKLDNWGAYIAALYKLTGDESNADVEIKNHIKKVLALLQQIKDQNRNLIMHPEVVLTPDEAFSLFEVTKGAIMTMADLLSLPVAKAQPPKATVSA